jgi:hypothetical protein
MGIPTKEGCPGAMGAVYGDILIILLFDDYRGELCFSSRELLGLILLVLPEGFGDGITIAVQVNFRYGNAFELPEVEVLNAVSPALLPRSSTS